MPQVRKQTGDLINKRYKILGPLGEGGFAVVYKAEDLAIGREVAVKILNMTASGHTPQQRETNIKRFRQEARTAAKIKHPNAVTIFDVGVTEDDNHPFMVMDLLQGHDLKDELIDNGPLTPERATQLFSRCLEALGEAHRLGIVHKDLKPSNLFLTDPGTDYESLVILDFGIAGFAQGNQKRLTQAGQILGTPQYMAPEYIANQTLAPALDVYQMGLILVEMLTGEPVVQGENMMHAIMVHAEGLLDIPASILDSPIGPIIRKATQRNADERYPDADAFRRALNAHAQTSSALLTSIPHTTQHNPHAHHAHHTPHTPSSPIPSHNPNATQANPNPQPIPVQSFIPAPGFASNPQQHTHQPQQHTHQPSNWDLPQHTHPPQQHHTHTPQHAFTAQHTSNTHQHTQPHLHNNTAAPEKPEGCIQRLGWLAVLGISIIALIFFGLIALLFGLAILGTQVES